MLVQNVCIEYRGRRVKLFRLTTEGRAAAGATSGNPDGWTRATAAGDGGRLDNQHPLSFCAVPDGLRATLRQVYVGMADTEKDDSGGATNGQADVIGCGDRGSTGGEARIYAAVESKKP